MANLAAWLGVDLDPTAHEQLETYGRWLVEEAQGAGGIGPDEGARLFDRHVGDSLGYLVGMSHDTESLVDVGSGVGLPGIPLAIVRPGCSVTLVDRSGRRCDLARRILRILDLPNAEVIHEDVDRLTGVWEVATFRASLPLDRAFAVFGDLTRPTGIGLFGLTRRSEAPEPPSPPTGISAEVLCAEPPVLDSPLWLLRMRGTSPDHPHPEL